MSRWIDADALIKSIESDRNCSDMPSQWINGVNYAIDLIELYEPTIKTKQVKYFDDDENVWKIGSVIVNSSEKPNNSTCSKMEHVRKE